MPGLLGRAVALPVVTGRAAGHDVVPGVAATAGRGQDVVPGEELPAAQLAAVPPAVLAGVVVPGEEEGVGDLAAEAVGNVDEAHEADDARDRARTRLSDRKRRLPSTSRISAFPSSTSRTARLGGTMVSGSNEAFSARQPTPDPPVTSSPGTCRLASSTRDESFRTYAGMARERQSSRRRCGVAATRRRRRRQSSATGSRSSASRTSPAGSANVPATQRAPAPSAAGERGAQEEVPPPAPVEPLDGRGRRPHELHRLARPACAARGAHQRRRPAAAASAAVGRQRLVGAAHHHVDQPHVGRIARALALRRAPARRSPRSRGVTAARMA